MKKQGKTVISSAAAAVACGRSILRHGRYDRRSGIVSGGHRGKILVTIGSKELAKNLQSFRIIKTVCMPGAAALPGVIASRAELGFDAAHTIGMQGTVFYGHERCTLQSFHAEWMVTKESGRNGGFEEKLRAAKKAGVRGVP